MINRVQGLVLGFFGLAWLALVLILVVAPSVYARTLPRTRVGRRVGELAFLVAISALIAVLYVGVVRRWRWTFWLVLIAFLAGVLRLPAAILELTGSISTRDPTWYVLFQAVVGLVQFAIGLALWAGYRRGGPWADF